MRRSAATALLVAVAVVAASACSKNGDGDRVAVPLAGDTSTPAFPTISAADDTSPTVLLPSSTIEKVPTSAPVVAAPDPTAATSTAVASAIGDRPYDLVIPTTYDPSVPMPLIVGLHGYTSSGPAQKSYFGLEPLAEERGFLLAHPDGTIDRVGQPFWNATDACCNLFRSSVDDSTYLTAVIDDVGATYNVDPRRIYVTGLSNGGFMSHRMACDRADRVAAIVSMAGAVFADPAMCTPSEPVNIVEIHGTSDETVLYDGDAFLGTAYPGASTTVSTWAMLNGCESVEPTDAGELDLVVDIDGDESMVETFDGCPPGGSVELWTMNGARHVPGLSPTFATTLVDWLYAHPDP